MCVRSLSRVLANSVVSSVGRRRLLSGIFFGTPRGVIAVEVFGSIAAPQVTFVAVSLAHFGFKRYLARSRKLIPQVQTAIGQQLRAELEVPRTLSPDLARLVSQLSFA